MQDGRARAIFLGMAALYDVASKAADGPIAPSIGLRAVLAFLFENSNGDREPFDAFWRECQNEWNGQTQPGYLRSTYTRTQWNRIASATGFDRMEGYTAISAALRRQNGR